MRIGWMLLLVVLGSGPALADGGKTSPHLNQILNALENRETGKPLNLPRSSWGAVSRLTPEGNLAAGDDPVISLLVAHRGADALARAGFELGTTTKRTAVVRAPLSRLAELAAMPEVIYIDAPVRTFRRNLDASGPEIGADNARGAAMPPYSGYTGDGVVVGVIDSGLDFNHEDFKDPSGDTRVLNLWDQTVNLDTPSGYNYGNECSPAEIDAGTCSQTDLVGHGTHVTSIAAGDGSEAGDGSAYTYVGVAPEADIVAVKYSGSKGDQGILDGVEYIFDQAGQRPAVVNISLGTGLGPHDGQTVLEWGLSDMTGPGRCIVSAAGNDGDVDTHAQVSVGNGNAIVVQFDLGAYVPNPGSSNDVIRVNAWYEGNANLHFTFTAPNGTDDVGPAAPATGAMANAGSGSGYLYIQNTGNNALNGDRQVIMQAYDSTGSNIPPSGTWAVTIQNNSGSRQTIDLWVYSDMYDSQGFEAEIGWEAAHTDPTMTINSPSTADDVIAVGAYVTKTSWPSTNGSNYFYPGETMGQIATFSSSGPRRDGVAKPELCAPGMGIVAARSAWAGDPSVYVVPSNEHVISQGTSQASPHVAGAVALLFEKDPTLDVEDVLNALQTSAETTTQSFLFPELYGAGKLRIDDALTPVRLLSFTALRGGDGVTLRWETAEADVAHYQVQRAAAADGPYATLAEVSHTGKVMTWVDAAPPAAGAWYRLRGVNRDGTIDLLATDRVHAVAPRLTLSQNAPNPFSESTQIRFSLDAPSHIVLDLIDLQGRRVATLAQDAFPAGESAVDWDGRLPNGSRIASGMYFYRLTSPGRVLTKRLVVAP